MPRDHAGRDVGGGIELRFLRDQVDLADAFGVKLEGDLLRRQLAVDMLAAGHRGRVVVEDLVGDVGARGDRLADRETAGVEIGAVAEIGEDVLLLGEGRDADPRHALAAHMRKRLGGAVHPQRHEVAADAGKGAAAFRHFRRRVVRAARAEIRRAGDGSHRLHLRRLAAVEPVGLGAEHALDFGIEIEAEKAFGERARKRGHAELGGEGEEALVVVVHLADDARTDVVAPVEQHLLDLVLDDLAAFLDDEDLLEADRELVHAFRLQRPGHADLVEPQTDLGGDLLGDAELAQRLADVLIALAGRHDAVTRVRRIHGDAVDLVGARKGDCRKTLVVLQPAVLLETVVRPAQIEPARRHLEIGGDDERRHLVGEIDLGGGLHRLGDHLHADPAAAIARHRNAEQAHLDHLVDAGRIEIRHQRGDEGVIRLVRHGGGFRAVVVAGKAQHAAVLGRARGIAVAEHVAAAIDAGALAVPDADHAVIVRAGRQVELLRAPDRGGRQILVHAGLELDVVLIEMLARGEQLLVIAAERRAAIAGDESRGVEPRGAVAPDLRHRQPDQRLDARQEDVARPLRVFLIETDRTLVDSHRRPRKPLAAPALFQLSMPFVIASLCRFFRVAQHNSGQ